jgi:DNA polymerase IIIc chi subunit
LAKPLMIAQKYHIDRVIRQATKLGMQSLVPTDLPGQFDQQSKQFWTRNKLFFIPLNLFAYVKLKIDGEL